MPDTDVLTTRPFTCEHCSFEIAERSDNALLKAGLEIEFKRTHYIKCPRCGEYTRFSIDRHERKGVSSI